jgi:hypothetical protein
LSPKKTKRRRRKRRGKNLDMAIRSPQIRDLIQLYAMSTGQKTTGMPGTVTPLSLVETGGSLFRRHSTTTALRFRVWEDSPDSTGSEAARRPVVAS